MNHKGGSRRETFAQIVAAVETAPALKDREPEATPGLYSGETLFDLKGNALREVDDHALDPEEIRAAVLGGALLVWDSCGCGGYCNALEWPTQDKLRKEAEASAPRFRKNDRARVSLLTGAGGDVLLVAGGLRWGDLFR
jgi:hypothetical protein